MNPKTLHALQDSIAHWERFASGKRNDGENIGYGSCALCRLFCEGEFDEGNDCKGCPVAKAAHPHCVGTPYERAADAWYQHSPDSREFRAAARKELEFLKSLLP